MILSRRLFRAIAAVLIIFCATAAVEAAVVRAKQGQVQIQRGARSLVAFVGQRLREGDELVTSPGAEVLIRFDDGARLALRQDSGLVMRQLKLKGPSSQRQKTVRVLRGSLRYISGRATVHQQVAFETSTATIGIRGTDIEIVVSEEPVQEDPAGTYLKVNSGGATIAAPDGTQVDVDPGQIAFGGEPDLMPRGPGGKRRPAARVVQTAPASLFGAGSFDKLMR